MKIYKALKLIFHGAKLLVSSNGNIKSLKVVSDIISNSRLNQRAVSELMKDDHLYERFVHKKGIAQLHMNQLLSLPAGTLGRRLGQFYQQNELDIYRTKEISSKLTESEYVSELIRRNHDIIHVLMAYDISLTGEGEVNAFVAAQLKTPFSIIAVISILVRSMIAEPLQFGNLMDRIVKAWMNGLHRKSFLLFDWDLWMDKPLDQVRSAISKATPDFVESSEERGGNSPQQSIYYNLQYLRPAILR